jgi:nitrite reductase/ring-hydroxylating ferredoxin subunit
VSEVFIAKLEEIEMGKRFLANVSGSEVMVFGHKGRVFAYENRCLHQGGPVAEGLILGRVVAVLDSEKRLLREEFSETEDQIICPWHGWAYSLETGECAGLQGVRLRKFEVIIEKGEVYVRTKD